ncbi:eukaryotic translation initiation factor 4B-like isoform X3 [Cimex lectularius]|uniref:RRM domain-containing protein n=1 Tax=Cimex lectularius TaxID=79782 RepID=A0A8I6TF70_CIMLE|nr:eukaryotic translation initiation factor 4B-like isoform X3 [Cimex lectularius]
MCSSRASKKNKTKWTPIPVEATSKKMVLATSWADEMEKEIDNFATDNVVLPTAPRSSRASNYDESKIPSVPPFQVYLSNIPYELTEDELANYFRDLKIKNVNLPREERGGGNRARGFAYMVLEDRASLIAALNKSDTVIKGRNINIELASNDSGRGGGMNRGGRGNRDGGRSDMGGPDRTATNWRTGPRSDEFQDRSSNYDRGYGGGRREFSTAGYRTNYDREDRGGYYRDDNRGGFDRERFGGRDGDRREGGFNYDRDRGYGREERGFGGDRDRGFSRGRDDRDDRYGRDDSSRGQWRDESKSFNKFDDRRDRDRDTRYGPKRDDLPPPSERGPGPAPPKQRPVLKLLPKSTTTPSEENGPASSTASIFGGAKPVDTAAREREIEDRLMRASEDINGSRSRGLGSGLSSHKDSQSESENKRVEPAPPPKENPWSRNRLHSSETTNNGRTTPDDSSSAPSQDDRGDSNKSWGRHRQESKRNDESKWGKGPPKSSANNYSSEKLKGGKDEKTPGKLRESKKENVDDFNKMPKVQETTVPNFAGSNKFSTLVDSDEAPTE